MTSDFLASKKSCLLSLFAAALLLAGCAAPIKSRPHVAGESYEGLRYHLSKTTVTVTFAAQLKSCAEGANRNQPSILLLAPTVSTQISADDTSSYVINPADSVNWFRKIEVPKLKLSADGRLAEAEAKSVDSTPAVLLNLAQVAFASRKAFSTASIAPRSSTQSFLRTWQLEGATAPTLLPATCNKQAKQQIDDFNAVRVAYENLRKLPRTLTAAKDFDKSAPERFKAIQDEELRLLVQLTELGNALTVRAELRLAGETTKPIATTLDLAENWVEETNYYGCDTLDVVAVRQSGLAAVSDAQKEQAKKDLSAVLAKQPLCVQISGNLSKGSAKGSASAPVADASSEAYPGLMFRVPAKGGISATAAGRAAPNQPSLIANFASNANARPVTNGWEWTAAGPMSATPPSSPRWKPGWCPGCRA